MYLNTCPRQGSRTIRTEVSSMIEIIYSSFMTLSTNPSLLRSALCILFKQEAIFVSLQYFQEPIHRALQLLGAES